jgi:uncharacterized protein (DUF1800 family)
VTINNTLIAANRFGLGARPGELASIDSDPRGWLLAQLAGTPVLPEPMRSLPSSAEIFQRYVEGQREKREAKMEAESAASNNADAAQAEKLVTGVRKVLAPLYLDQVAARYRVAATTSDPFRERLVHFWTNHFAVSADKVSVTALAGALENEAIRPNISSHFPDLLLAVETHPAMLLYLDNQASIGADSRLATMAARRGESDRKIGINENLAREILELHTLGVDGGYTQTDVTTFAGAITGWSIGGGRGRLAAGEPGRFVFRPAMHEPGAKTILGKRYGDDGFEQGKAVLRDLARHPATAHHIATKLVRHFVADEPPASAVEHIAKVFRDSDGHLPTVHRAVVELSDAWTTPFAKFKTPHDFVISTYRAFDFVPTTPQQIFGSFQLLGQRPYTPGSPAGWPDVASQWDGPDALMKRIEWSTVVGQRASAKQSPLAVADAALGSGLGDHSRTVISRAASPAQGFALLLASPEFQRR